MGAELATIGLALLFFASISWRLSGTILTPAMVVVAIGVLAGPSRSWCSAPCCSVRRSNTSAGRSPCMRC